MFNAINLYRAGRLFYIYKIPFIPFVIKCLIFLLYNSVIPFSANIGKKSKFAYGGMSVVIHKNAIIGEKVIIGQNVTVGRALDPSGVPVIGNNVYISAGARIIGGIKIGNNVIVGANAVVNKDVSDNSIVVGVPAKAVRTVECSIWDLLKNMY